MAGHSRSKNGVASLAYGPGIHVLDMLQDVDTRHKAGHDAEYSGALLYMTESKSSLRIFVDADACPVKDEVYKVAARHAVPVMVVAGGFIRVPQDPLIERVAAGAGMDAADDWIAERADGASIVITSDVPLASRCVKAGAAVIAPNGRAFTEQSIGMTLAVRNLMHDLRSSGEVTGGPAPFKPSDRSAFLSALDQSIRRLRRAQQG